MKASRSVAVDLVACLAVAGAALSVGLLVYLTDRDGTRAWLVPMVAPLAGRHLFGVVGGSLPSFVHPLAFGLLSAAAFSSLRWRCLACAAWGVVNLAFEAGQHPRISAPLAHAVLELGGTNPATLALARYFTHGTFDPLDLVAVLLGTLAAMTVLRLLASQKGTKHAA